MAPVLSAFCEVVGRSARAYEPLEQHLGDQRRHDQGARVDQPLQLCAFGRPGAPVTERQGRDGGQAGDGDQQRRRPCATSVEDVPGRPGHADRVRRRRAVREDGGGERGAHDPPGQARPGGPGHRPPAARGQVPRGKQQHDEHAQPDAQQAQVQPSQLARVSVRGKCNSNTPKTATAYARPVADSSHPMGFPGRFHASNAPTVAKAPMNTTADRPVQPAPGLGGQLRGQRVQGVEHERGRGRRHRDGPDRPRAPERCHRSPLGPSSAPRATLRSDRSRIVTAVALFDGDGVGG